MNQISNCGLVVGCNGKTYLTDIKRYSGTFVLDMFGNVERVISDALMWYSAVDETDIYFSNQKYQNYLCVYHTATGQLGLVKELACKNIVKHEKKLYFIEEESKNIMCYSIVNGSTEKISDTKVEVFSVCGEIIYYSSVAGTGVIHLGNRVERAILSSVAETLGFWNQMLLFSDFNGNSVLSIYQPSDGGFFRIEAMKTDSFLTFENYIYAIHKTEGNSLCRIDISKGEIMRIYGESVYNLHIVGTDLYFTDVYNDWCRMSVTGDSFVKIRAN